MTKQIQTVLERIVERIYYKGIHDGIDITNGAKDRFWGNKSARKKYENEFILEQTKELAQSQQEEVNRDRERIIQTIADMEEAAGDTCSATEGSQGCDEANFYQEMGKELTKIFEALQTKEGDVRKNRTTEL